MSKLRFPDYVRSRNQALEYACEKGGANPEKGRGYLRLVLEGDIAQNTTYARAADALLNVSGLLGNDQVAVWDFTSWDPKTGLGVENFDQAAARLLSEVAQSGEIAKVIRAGRMLGNLVGDDQVTDACTTASRIRTAMTALPPAAAAPAETTQVEGERAAG